MEAFLSLNVCWRCCHLPMSDGGFFVSQCLLEVFICLLEVLSSPNVCWRLFCLPMSVGGVLIFQCLLEVVSYLPMYGGVVSYNESRCE